MVNVDWLTDWLNNNYWFNVGIAIIKHPPNHKKNGGINHEKNGGLLLLYPHYSIWFFIGMIMG